MPRAGRLEEALRDLDEAIALKPDYAEAYVNRGNVYLAAKRYADAIADYGRAIACNPRYADAWYNRAIARRGMKQDDEALADLRMARKLGKTVPEEFLRSFGPSGQPAP